MITAKKVMVPLRKVVTVSPEDSVQDAIEKLAGAHVSGAPVVTGPGKKVVGVISESDILRYIGREEGEAGGERAVASLERALPTKVKQLMAKTVVSVGPDEGLDKVVRLMTARKVNRVVVVDAKESLVGLVTRADVLRAAPAI